MTETTMTETTMTETSDNPSVESPVASRSASEASTAPPSLSHLIVNGARSVRRYWGLFSVLYLVQLTIAGLATWTVSIMLATVFAQRPLFDQAVDGDLSALIFVITDQPYVFTSIAWLALATVMGYALLSWYLIGGLNAVLVHAPPPGDERKATRGEVIKHFGAGGARTFFAYARLFLLSLIPYAIIAAVFLYGLSGAAHELAYGLTFTDVLAVTAPKLLPAFLLYLLHTTALDYARIELSRTIGLASRHALWRGYKRVARDWRPLAHVLLYLLAFALVSYIYVWGTQGQAMAGAAGAIALFGLRQLVSAARFAAKMVCAAGQVVYANALSGDTQPRKRLPVIGS